MHLVIEDSSPSVPEDLQTQIFERLYRVEESRSRATGGAGLGLAICKSLVEAHKGIIIAQTAKSGGLKITIKLPIFQDNYNTL
jgi:two-component system sensor histidine kinase BaeS